MKNKTKHKIVRWFDRWVKYILNYPEPPIQIFKEGTRKIQIIQWSGILYEYDVKHNLDEFVAMELAKQIVKIKIVQVKVKKDEFDGAYKINARAYFIEPINDDWLNY